MVISKTHFETAILEQSLSESHEIPVEYGQFLNSVEHDHFSMWWNLVIAQFGGTKSLLNLVEHSHFSVWWNTVILKFGGTESFSRLVEHGHFLILWNTVISQLGGWG